MPLNKDLIIKLIVTTITVLFALRVFIPLIIDKLKGKDLGLSKNTGEIDYLIKKQKDFLKSTYNVQSSSKPNHPVNEIKNEINWGGTELKKSLKDNLQKNYNYQFSDSKLSSFFHLIEKRNYLSLINDEKINKENILNLFSSLFIFLVLIDENKQNEFHFTEKCAKKINISALELTLAIQLKIVLINKYFKLKDEVIFSDHPILHKISDESLNKTINEIIIQEWVLWAKSPSYFFEELSLYVQYATLISPMNKLIDKNDLKNARINLSIDENSDLELIKKNYKKLAISFHPDKVSSMKLPTNVEQIVKNKFQIIQQSFEIVSKQVKNESKASTKK